MARTARRPGLVEIASLVMGLLCAIGAISGFVFVRSHGSAPIPVSIADAASLLPTGFRPKPWVEITDGAFRCESLQESPADPESDDYTWVLVTDQDRKILIEAEFDGYLTCAQAKEEKAVGLLSRAKRNDLKWMLSQAEQFEVGAYKDAQTFMRLHAGYSPRAELVATLLTVLFALLCLSVYPVSLISYKVQRLGQKKQGSLRDDTTQRE